MLLMIQISAAQGPQECERAVAITLRAMLKDAEAHGVMLQIVEDHATPAGHKSVLLQTRSASAAAWLEGWEGSVQCVFSSPFRPGHRRKNWFVGVQRCEAPEHGAPLDERDIVFQACRASGKGGQHVNTTDSAVHAVHTPSGIAVKVMTERSQHANKRLACALIAMKLAQQSEERRAHARRERSQQHWEVDRGHPVKRLQG